MPITPMHDHAAISNLSHTEGPDRGRPRMFLSGPLGCEVCAPAFTPDYRTFGVAI